MAPSECISKITSLYRFSDKSSSIIYTSSAVHQIELVCEFIWEYLHEDVTPLIAGFELAKAACKMNEYQCLALREDFSAYVGKEVYEEVKKESKVNQTKMILPRSEK